MQRSADSTRLDLTTVGTFTWVHEAHLARAFLESHGLEAFVADDNVVTVDPLASTAYGGVKVRVRREDVYRAAAVLGEYRTGYAAAGSGIDTIGGDAGSDEPAPEELVRRAYVAAVFGIVFIPLQLYSLWLLARFAPHREEVPRAVRRRAVAALAIDGWFLLVTVLLLAH